MNKIELKPGQMIHHIYDLKDHEYFDFINTCWTKIPKRAGMFVPSFYCNFSLENAFKEFDEFLIQNSTAIGFYYSNDTFTVVRKIK